MGPAGLTSSYKLMTVMVKLQEEQQKLGKAPNKGILLSRVSARTCTELSDLSQQDSKMELKPGTLEVIEATS